MRKPNERETTQQQRHKDFYSMRYWLLSKTTKQHQLLCDNILIHVEGGTHNNQLASN